MVQRGIVNPCAWTVWLLFIHAEKEKKIKKYET